jgi:hypothetical protein
MCSKERLYIGNGLNWKSSEAEFIDQYLLEGCLATQTCPFDFPFTSLVLLARIFFSALLVINAESSSGIYIYSISFKQSI